MDILSDVLRAVRLTGAVFFEVEATPPWVSEAPHARLVAAQAIPGAQHVIEYHIVTEGQCWGTTVGGTESVRLGSGSVIVFPHGDPHVLSSEPGMRAPPDLDAFDGREQQDPPYRVVLHGGGLEPVRFICGFLGCDLLPFNPVIQALPPQLHVPGAYTANDEWLKNLIAAIVREGSDRRAGSSTVLAKLSELIFIEIIRCYLELQAANATGWFAALADPCAGNAIRIMHAEPRRAWTLAALGREVGFSRTLLVDSFNRHLGIPPMTYLSNWRMQLAAGMLMEGSKTLAQVADHVGYESEASFSRAFKRFTGLAPSRWRARNEAPQTSPG